MADNNQSVFQILIKSIADLTGFKQTEAAAKGLASGPGIPGPVASLVPGLAEIGTIAAAGLGVAIPAAAGAAYAALKQISEFQERLNEEIAKEYNFLDKAAAGWRELAASASNIKDIDKLSGDVAKGIELITQRQKELQVQTLTTTQSLTDISATLLKLSAGFRGIWTPYTTALKEAQEEQKKLAQSAIEAGAAAIKAGEQSKASWEAVKLEPINQAVTEYTAKLKAYEDVQARVNLTTQEGIDLYKFYQDRIVETSARLDQLIQIQKRESAEHAREAAEAEKERARNGAERQKFIDAAAGSISPQAKAIQQNEDAARRARAAGQGNDADLFQRQADEFRKSASQGTRDELDQLGRARGDIGARPGRKADVGESQEAVDAIERNRINNERALQGQQPGASAQPASGGQSSAELVAAVKEQTGVLRALQQQWA